MGAVLRIGTAILEVFDPSGRCVVTTLAQGDLGREPAVLRTVARSIAVPSLTLAPGVVVEAVAGIYARVVRPGDVAPGDVVSIEAGSGGGGSGGAGPTHA